MVPSTVQKRKASSDRHRAWRSARSTHRDAFTAVFEGRRPMRIPLEASTESEWVADDLETLGREVDRGRSDGCAHVQRA
jgi:hypothetical protein